MKITRLAETPKYKAAAAKLEALTKEQGRLERALAETDNPSSVQEAAGRLLRGEPEPAKTIIDRPATARQLQIVCKAIEMQTEEVSRLRLEASRALVREMTPHCHDLIRQRLQLARKILDLFHQERLVEEAVLEAGYVASGLPVLAWPTMTIAILDRDGDQPLDREIREAVKAGIIKPDDPLCKP